MLTKEQFQPDKNEQQELQNIKDLLTSIDDESKKLGKTAFFTSNYYKRIRHKNLRIKYSFKFSLTVQPNYIELNKKLDTDILIAFINYLLKFKEKKAHDFWQWNIKYLCFGACYIYDL